MKKIVIALLILVALAIGVYFFLHTRHQPALNSEVKRRLIQLVHDGSNGLYHLEIDSLEANVADMRLTIFNARLRADTVVYERFVQQRRAGPDLFEASVDRFTIDNISAGDFLTAKEINLDRLLIKNPSITVKHRKLDYVKLDKDSAKTVYQRLSDKISRIKIDTIFVEHADFTYDNLKKKRQTRVKKISFLANDFLIDASTQFDPDRFFFTKNTKIRIQDYRLFTRDSLYVLNVGDLFVETAPKYLEVAQLTFKPTVDTRRFYHIFKHQQDRFALSVGKVRIKNIDWYSMIENEVLAVHHLELESPKLDIYNDKSMPPDSRSKVGKYPHQLLRKLAFGLAVDTIRVKNMNLQYTELNPKSKKTGTLSFNNISATLMNVTNDSASIVKNPFLRVNAIAKFMNEAPITAGFVFDLKNHKQGKFEVNAKVGRLSAAAVNKVSVPLGMVRIDELNINGMEARIKGDNYQASGQIKLEYDHLKISILKNNEDTLAKRKLFSFLANTFVLKQQNPDKGKPVRIVQTQFQRDTHRSFFNLVWKTIFTGAKKTVGYK